MRLSMQEIILLQKYTDKVSNYVVFAQYYRRPLEIRVCGFCLDFISESKHVLWFTFLPFRKST